LEAQLNITVTQQQQQREPKQSILRKFIVYESEWSAAATGKNIKTFLFKTRHQRKYIYIKNKK